MFRTNIPVLCYHAVGERDGHTPARFREHLDVIRDMGLTPISARELYDICLRKTKPRGKPVVLTFDDCHLSNWTNVIPELARRKIPGVFFAVTDFIGDGPARTKENAPRLKSVPDSFRAALREGDFSQFMNREEIRSAINDFGMEVYAHSSRHQACFRNMRRVGRKNGVAHWGCDGIYDRFGSDDPVFDTGSGYAYNGFHPMAPDKGNSGDGRRFRLRTRKERFEFCLDDFTRSMQIISELNESDLQLFCWPWGAYDRVSEKALKAAGFHGAFTLERDFNGPGTDPFRLNRIGVASKQDGKWLKSRLNLYSKELVSRVLVKKYRNNPAPETVLYITDSTKLSGGSRQMVNNALSMLDHGLKVVVSVPTDSVIKTAFEGTDAVLEDNDGLRGYASSVSFIRRVVKEHEVDAVHTFHNRAVKMAALARLCGKKFKLFFNRGVIFRPNTLAPLWARIGDGYICNSFAGAGVLKKHLVPADRLNVVFNSCLIPKPEPRPSFTTTVLYLGNAAPAKGFDVYLKMVEQLMLTGRDKGLAFTAVGVEKMDPFKDLVPKAVLDRVRSTGTVPHEQVLEEVAGASILVLSSRKESMPNALLEGFMAGAVPVCTRAGGIPELVAHGVNGYLCPREDAAALARHVRFLADNPGLRDRMSGLNRRIPDLYFSNEIKGRNLLHLYSGGRQYVRSPLDIKENT